MPHIAQHVTWHAFHIPKDSLHLPGLCKRNDRPGFWAVHKCMYLSPSGPRGPASLALRLYVRSRSSLTRVDGGGSLTTEISLTWKRTAVRGIRATFLSRLISRFVFFGDIIIRPASVVGSLLAFCFFYTVASMHPR